MSKYSREQLAEMKVAELKSICKENGIKHYNGKNRYTKQQMIDAIVAFPEEQQEEQKEEQKEEQQVEKSEKKLEDNPKAKESKCNEEEVKNTEDAESKRKAYVENIAIGTIVAFRTQDGKVKSAKVINKSSKYRRLKLETKYGAIYVIKYEDVIWVKTGKRFPRGVYNLLKGIETIEQK